MKVKASTPCPCGLEKVFENCCARFLFGHALPQSSEELMRSRYTAFCLVKMDYLWETTAPETRHLFNKEANQNWAESVAFTKLEVLSVREEDDQATVEFKAYFREQAKTCIHWERSRFRREKGRWFFCQGILTY